MSRTKACDGGCWKTYSYISYLKLKKNGCDSKCEEPRVFLNAMQWAFKKKKRSFFDASSFAGASYSATLGWSDGTWDIFGTAQFEGEVSNLPHSWSKVWHESQFWEGHVFFWHFLHPWKLTWNPKMKVWKMIILFKQVMFRFHVNFPGCTTDCVEWTTSPKWYPTRSCVEPAR